MLDATLSVSQISAWLQETDRQKLSKLYAAADALRKERVGDGVWFRGLIEISSYCRRNCLYCGIRAARKLTRYRMTREEIVESARKAYEFQFGTVVLQAGEDLLLDENFIVDVVREIKERFGLAITLSLGERKDREWIKWKEAGADRYLLRFETSNPQLYKAIHPLANDVVYPNRIAMLKRLREIGYEIGTGVMIGVPGQTYDDLARDLALFRELDVDMIGCGPFLPHSHTPLGRATVQDGYWRSLPPTESEIDSPTNVPFAYPFSDAQVPADVATTFKVVALARILCPNANIPSTTAVATLDANDGRKGALERGANVVMPNVTPRKYRALYEIYPNKSASFEDPDATRLQELKHLEEIGRFQGVGAGSSYSFQTRRRQ